MYSKNEFDLLVTLLKGSFKSQREIADASELSLGLVNGLIQKYQEDGLIDDQYRLTEAGIASLAPYKVDNAIIMAAGMSSRFAPISYEKPKGVLVVKDEVLIERQIKQLHEVGIKDITIVLGYMKEQFFYLEEKFNVNLVINDDYFKYNNTSTLMLVRDRLANTYICSSDNYFSENVFEPYVYQAYYPVLEAESQPSEYYVEFDHQNIIKKVTIGEGHWMMMGHVYFDHEFSKTFVDILTQEYEKEETKQNLWEKLYIRYTKQLRLEARQYQPGIIHEFDSLDELRSFDPTYINNADSRILKNIASTLDCQIKDIIGIESIKKGLTNTSFMFTVFDKRYVYRHPGIGTDDYINRESECFSQEVAKELNLDDSFLFMEKDKGWKLSKYLDDCDTLDYHNEAQVKEALSMVKKLHDAKVQSQWDFGIWEKSLEFINKISSNGRTMFNDFTTLFELLENVYNLTEKDGYPKVLCHCDFYDPNILISKGRMYLIDWEYSGNDDPANDLGTFIACSDYSYEEAMEVLDWYEGSVMTDQKRRHFVGYIALASYYWFVWAIYQESVGNNVGEYLYIWYKNARFYGTKAIEMYEGETTWNYSEKLSSI